MVIPTAQRRLMLAVPNECHPGIAAMQSLARFYTWWPKMDQDINDWVKECQACQENRGQEPESDAGDQDLWLQRFPLSYRNTPHATTGKAPAELFLGHRLPTLLDRLKPDPRNKMEVWKQKVYHDTNVRARSLRQGDEEWVKNKCKPGLQPGVVERRTGKLSYEVLISGQMKRKHDQLRAS
ncbi:hypothetical protein J437_LFUL013501 [Ladona fulva]|uniref:RNA-directed DNA polymerase n=1 Tax=Ladona fulva TaxID=123851 RepID=A0A8K0KHW4_LADFU|nr:hypothetical protein J437_LFUL013501 [Ladona fulva]